MYFNTHNFKCVTSDIYITFSKRGLSILRAVYFYCYVENYGGDSDKHGSVSDKMRRVHGFETKDFA